jgi:hypothetical protein
MSDESIAAAVRGKTIANVTVAEVPNQGEHGAGERVTFLFDDGSELSLTVRHERSDDPSAPSRWSRRSSQIRRAGDVCAVCERVMDDSIRATVCPYRPNHPQWVRPFPRLMSRPSAVAVVKLRTKGTYAAILASTTPPGGVGVLPPIFVSPPISISPSSASD